MRSSRDEHSSCVWYTASSMCRLLLILLLGLLVGAPVAWAEEGDASDVGDEAAKAEPSPPTPSPTPQAALRQRINEVTKDKSGPDDIDVTLDQIEAFKESGRLRRRPLIPAWDRFQAQLADRHRLKLGLAYTAVYQRATSADGPRDAAGGDFDIIARWQAYGCEGCNAGYLNVLFEARHRIFTDIAPSGLGESVGSLWPTIVAFNVQSFIPKQVYWEQEFGPRGSKVIAGIIDPAIIFFGTRATDQNFTFLNSLFSDNPSVAYPSPGLGGVVTWKPLECLQLRGGVCDANGSRTDDPYEDFLQGEFFYAAEVIFQPEIRRLGVGNYRVGLWYADARKEERQPEGGGLAINFDQDLGEDVMVFGMYDLGFDGVKETRQSVRGGFGVWGPFRHDDDLLGLGFGWGQPTDRTRRSQLTGEVFYRIQVSPEVQLTPSFQWIRDPSLTANRSDVGILGLRFRIAL